MADPDTFQSASTGNDTTPEATSGSAIEGRESISAWETRGTIDGGQQQIGQRLLMESATSFSPVASPATTALVDGDVAAGSTNSAAIVSTSAVTEQYSGMGRRDVVTPPMGSIPSGGAVVSVHSGSTTPQLSPSVLASLRGTSSPSHSQVSVGSAPNPTLMNAVLSSAQHKHYDLTPVTRNTSDIYCDAKDMNTAAGNDSSFMTITPSSQEGFLHGEHLAFPSDLSRATLASGPAMPPLQPVVHRRDSSSSNLRADSVTTDDDNDPSFLQMDSIPPGGLYRNEIEIPNEPAVHFPSRKYYSFTTREQYEEACRYDPDSDDDLFIPSDSDDDDIQRITNAHKGILPRMMGLTPYAPHSRPANFDIEQLPEEELKRIFITRATNATSANVNDETSAAAADLLLSSGNQFTGASTIPLEQRIPSLRMANHLLNDSTTSISYTDNEDEDSVIRVTSRTGIENDDASLSSLGSNLNLQQMATNTEAEQDDDLITAAKLHLRKHRKRKQRKKEQDAAMEWLQSVEAHPDNDIAEAASSKFLTATTLPSPYHTSNININNTLRRQHHYHPPSNTIVVPLQRQMSSPPITNIPTTTSPFTKVLPTTATTKRPPH
jgi:hypothetical protein